MNNMHIDRKTYIIGGVLGLVAIVVIAGLFLKGSSFGEEEQGVSTDDPVNIVLDFYDSWLLAVQTTSTDPYQSGLAKAPILSKELRERLSNAEGSSQEELDPVLCQTKVPLGISARLVYERDDSAQVLVMSTEKESLEQAIITLIRHNDGWYIGDIECSPGEFAPEREFSFEMEGYLLKSVEPPLNPQNWHLVFEENNEQGHVVPLFFNAESVCIGTDGRESVCSPEQLTETSKASIHGGMTELGVEVKRLELIRE